MRLAIMHPYFFPYLGYFQLIDAVDRFVVYDDVNYIKGGWINRNCILGNDGRRQLVTLQAVGASQNKRINQVQAGSNRASLLKTISQNYSRAPQFRNVIALVEKILGDDEADLSLFLYRQLQLVSEFLGLQVDWMLSSEQSIGVGLKGQDRILEICGELGADTYVNAIGGRQLYDGEAFAARGVELSFIQSRFSPYPQFDNDFVPGLSIIDVMMFNDRAACRQLLGDYELVD